MLRYFLITSSLLLGCITSTPKQLPAIDAQAKGTPDAPHKLPNQDLREQGKDVAPTERQIINKLDHVIDPLIKDKWIVGMVIGLIHGKQTQYYDYGKLSRENSLSPNAETIFEIGSVTKVFTALALAELVSKNIVQLDTPVEKLLPASVNMPKYKETQITLAHLATHTSGLPRLPTNLGPKDINNPYSDYTVEQLYTFLSGYTLLREPGASYEYSNLGMGLLGHALALQRVQSYEAMIEDLILKPLNMKNTKISLSASEKKRFAQGFNVDADPVAHWDIPTLAGAGAIRSTAKDLASFLRANLAPESTSLAGALSLMQKPRALTSIEKVQIGLGWHISENGRIWHNGMTGGFASYVGFDRKRGTGVVVLANTASNLIDRVGVSVMDLLEGKPVKDFELAPNIKVASQILSRYVGQYRLMPQLILSVTLEGDRLYVQATGQGKYRVFAKSETEFYYRVVDAQLTFLIEDGKVAQLILHQNGRSMPATKL